jgi:hypothetical protein
MVEKTEKEEVKKIANTVAATLLSSEIKPDWTLVFDTTDNEGNAALDITFTLTNESSSSRLSGDAVLSTTVKIHDRLIERGDERFPFVHFATVDEQKEVSDDES